MNFFKGESFDQILVAWVGEESQTLPELLCREECVGGKILLLFGPEGGWTDEEIDTITSCGGKSFSLGPRILRAETAPVAALAVAQTLVGDMVVV